MALRTDRQDGEIIDNEDINAIAGAVNDHTDRLVSLESDIGGGGTTDHAALTNRDASDQHPIRAITGLQSELNGKAKETHGHTIGDVEYLQIALDNKAEGGHGHTSAAITDLTEAVQDIVGAFIKAGTNTSVTYDDAANTFTINATASGGTTDPEVVRDTIGGALVAGAGVQIVVNDAGDTITVSSTAVLPTRKIVAGTGLTGGGDLSTDRTLAVAYGTTAGTAAQGNHTHTGYAPATQTINAQTGTAYTLAAADAGKVVTVTNAAAQTITVPANVFTAGQRVDVLRAGAGSLTLAAGSGMTLNGTPSLVLRAQWSAASVLFLSATEGVVIGDLATP